MRPYPTERTIIMAIDYKSILVDAGLSGVKTAFITAGVGIIGAAISSLIESHLAPKDEPEFVEAEFEDDPVVIDHEETIEE